MYHGRSAGALASMTTFLKAKVQVEQFDDTNWLVLQGFDYQGKKKLYEVEVGESTDFASVPRLFVWLLPRYGRWTKAAILHDHLWRREVGNGPEKTPYTDADAIFRRAMRDLDVPFLKRWIMWGAVRWGALFKSGGRTGWLKDAPRVLLLTVLALPIVLPPAVLIAVALVLFYLVECVVWVPLKVNEIVRRRLSRDAKKVVAPRLTYKL
jgi:hypothetical protein